MTYVANPMRPKPSVLVALAEIAVQLKQYVGGFIANRRSANDLCEAVATRKKKSQAWARGE